MFGRASSRLNNRHAKTTSRKTIAITVAHPPLVLQKPRIHAGLRRVPCWSSKPAGARIHDATYESDHSYNIPSSLRDA